MNQREVVNRLRNIEANTAPRYSAPYSVQSAHKRVYQFVPWVAGLAAHAVMLTVPDGYTWKIEVIYCDYVADATVADRVLHIAYVDRTVKDMTTLDATNVHFNMYANEAISSGNAIQILAPSMSYKPFAGIVAGMENEVLSIPEMKLYSGESVFVRYMNGAAGDLFRFSITYFEERLV